jgi:AraC-like DNA-binding protein
MMVQLTLEKLNLPFVSVVLGEVELIQPLTDEMLLLLKNNLEQLGFELLSDKKSKIVEKIKNILIESLYHYPAFDGIKLSKYLSQKMPYDYSYLSHLFSQIEGITIEKYFIAQKIEKVKELLVYNELSLSQIADQLA